MLITLSASLLAASSVQANNPLAWISPALCAETEGVRQITRRKIIGVLLKEYPVTLDADAFNAAPLRLADRIATADCGGDIACKQVGPLRKLKSAAVDMLEVRRSANFELTWIGPGVEPEDEEEQIRAFYDLGQTSYRLTCLTQPATPVAPDPAKPSFLERLTIASALAETEKGFGKRDPAKISFRADREAGTESATVKIAVMTPPIAQWTMSRDQPLDGSLRAFAAYDRLTAADPAKAVNTLDLGVRTAWTLDVQGGGPLVFGGDLAWQSDDDLKSSLTRGELFLRPGLTWKGYGRDYFLTDGPGYTLRFNWDMRFLVDHVEVHDPGDKPGLLNKKNYTRGGYDLDAGLRLRRRAADPTFGFSLAYKFRDDWSGSPANADRFTGKLQYFPKDDSHFAFGLEYDRGEDLTAFSKIESWLITFGYRQ